MRERVWTVGWEVMITIFTLLLVYFVTSLARDLNMRAQFPHLYFMVIGLGYL